ncbi:MAG: PhnD/SsuA/transferrin family substrate-binding protein [Candidatus Binatia bacterium]
MPAVVVSVLAMPALAAPPPSRVNVLVLKEHGVGGASLAQGYLDRFIKLAATQYGWSDAHGQYQTTRAGAESYIRDEKPRFGILSLAAFLAFHQKYQLEVVGTAVVSRAGGQQYFLISKKAADAKGCFGQTMATDHADDPRFIERVVSGKAFALGDFKLVETQRPLQAIKKVLTGDAVCALIDDAQMAELPHIEGAEGIRSVWESSKFPSMTLVAFGTTSAADRKKFKDGLSSLCNGEGKTACAEVGIMALSAADAGSYSGVLSAYGK